MSNDPLVYQMQTEMKVIELQQSEPVRPEATQQVAAAPIDADTGGFSRETCEVVSALMAAQMGLGLIHHLAVETFQRAEEQPIPPRRLPEEEPAPKP